MKYIDSEKLIAEIERRRKQRIEANDKIAKGEIFAETEDEFNSSLARYGNRLVYQELFEIICFIETIQQEQPMPDSTELIEFWNEDKEMLKEKDFRDDAWRLAYNAFMCGFGRGIAVKQEQPEVDFETEYAKFSNDPDALDYAFPIDLADYKDFAHHFYEFGLNARKEK